MKLVKVLDKRRMYEKDGKEFSSVNYRLYDDVGHYVTVKPAFSKNERDWVALSFMVSDTITIEKGE